MKKNNFNLFNSFLIITLLVLISVPFSISFNKSEKLNIKKNVASAETNLQIAQRELNEAKANLNKVQIIIRDLNTKLSEDKANNLNTTELEAQITSLVNIVENAARAAVVAAEKKVFIEQTLSDSLVSISPVNKSKNESIYKLLAPIGGITCMDSSGQDPKCITNDIGKYLNIIFKLAIGISAALAVIMLIINGVKYMGDESVFGKTEAKKQMFGAIVGLLIALGSWALLNTINPALTGQNGLSISAAEIEIAGDTDVPINFNKNTLPTGIVCSGGKANIPNIVSSFAKKMTYEMGAKGVAGPENTIKLDCSGFVNYVLRCADINAISGGTASIFSNAEKVIQTSIQGTKINNKELNIGDLVGWRAGENGEKFGHVMIYIGNGQLQLADSHGTKVIGGALGTFPISKYQPRIKYVKRIP